MLMDMLGVLIGFIAIITLLSLVVMALVQVMENMFHLRARNLLHGLQCVFELEGIKPPPGKEREEKTGEKEKTDSPAAQARQLAERVVSPGLLSKKKLRPYSAGPIIDEPVTWIESEKLPERLAAAGVELDGKSSKAVVETFKNMDGMLRRRFGNQMRLVTVLCSIPIAFLFQVSTPSLLNDLSTDPALRAEAIAVAEALNREAASTLAALPTYEEISDRALEELEAMHPDLTQYIEQAAGIGTDREDIILELRDVLCEDVPTQCEQVVRDYEELLDNYRNKAVEDAVRIAATSTNSLARVSITAWQGGWAFYKDVGNVFGVLVTIILMSFGAPFWYGKLGELLKLRDILKPFEAKK